MYRWEAVEELNIKAMDWKDLLTEEPFSRKDIIQIQVTRDIILGILGILSWGYYSNPDD